MTCIWNLDERVAETHFNDEGVKGGYRTSAYSPSVGYSNTEYLTSYFIIYEDCAGGDEGFGWQIIVTSDFKTAS